MSYKVDYDALDSMCLNINSQAQKWQDEISELEDKISILLESTNMSGKAADNIKCYMETVHITLLGLLKRLLYLHTANCMIYKTDYQKNIDTGLHVKIFSSELDSYERELKKNRTSTNVIHDEVNRILKQISDIYYIKLANVNNLNGDYKSAIDFLSNLDEKIKVLERKHHTKDFTNTYEMIRTLTSFILEQKSYGRDYKTEFSLETIFKSDKFKELCNTYVKVCDEIDKKTEEIETAIDNENDRVAALQKEIEEREDIAKVINYIVAGTLIVASIAITVGTGGAGTPLAVAGISAASGAIMAGTGNLTAQYVEHGNLIENSDEIDWASFGTDVVIAGVTGFVTGYVGTTASNFITSGANFFVPNAVNSTNSIVRIGTGAAVGAVSEVSSGIVTRGIGTYLTTGDSKAAVKDAFDGKNIAFDAALGGVAGGVEQVTSIKEAQKAVDAETLEYNSKYNPFEKGEKNGLKGIKPTERNGVDFAESDHILRTKEGAPIEVKIKSTGSRSKDYKLAEDILKNEYGIDIDFKSMRTGQNRTHVWHHVDDYNVMTNETTMQFIEIDAHKAIGNHSGSANQYHIAHGKGYAKQVVDTDYEGVDILNYIDPVVDKSEAVKENMEDIESSEAAKENIERIQSSVDVIKGMKSSIDYLNNAVDLQPQILAYGMR